MRTFNAVSSDSTPYNGLYGEAPPERGTFQAGGIQGLHELKYRKGLGKLSFRITRNSQNISNGHTLRLIYPSILRVFSSDKFSKRRSVGILKGYNFL